LQNTGNRPQSEILVNLPQGFLNTIQLERAQLLADLPELCAQVYRIDPPLLPGEKLTLKSTCSYEAPALEFELKFPTLVQNGLTLFGVRPTIGYDKHRELTDEKDRQVRGLTKRQLSSALDTQKSNGRQKHSGATDSDLLKVETIVSTDSDQVAIAPGALLDTWSQHNRRYFHYRLDDPTRAFVPIVLSARLKVASAMYENIATEVWYHPDHEWNVPNFMHGLHSALSYCTSNFGPYQYKFARVVEFPRYKGKLAAMAFPGTMPYSESAGFTADTRLAGAFDTVFFVVAHEVAHQWWAYQVVAADMEGEDLLQESLAEYTAVMVMEREFGPEMVRRWLSVARHSYLIGRADEATIEHPLSKVRHDQKYVAYYKGCIVMYYLKQLIGEQKINSALRKLLLKFKDKGPPYAVSTDLIDALRTETPPQYHPLLDDLFNRIILFSNKINLASMERFADGRRRITLEVECQKLEINEKGVEQTVPFEQPIEIGVFSAPLNGQQYGDSLHQQMHTLKSGRNTIVLETTGTPDTVVVDPFFLLIDRNTANNVATLTTEP
ncbi:MAG: M1 family aminopeptidase, partial [Bacteroidota bacterium]